MTLHALILAMAALLGRGTPPSHVVSAIETACTEEAARYPVDGQACVALVTTYAAHESGYRPGIFGDSGASYGLLQEPAAVARPLDALGQVRWWLSTLRQGTLAGLDSSPTRAARRERRARVLLAQARADLAARGVVEAQP